MIQLYLWLMIVIIRQYIWKDKKFGESKGLDALVGNRQLDVIIGGPPCQAYSVAGRIRDEHGMREDYRNYLFESYLKVVQHYKPRVFVFENVPGILSAKPGDGSVRIIDLIQKAFADAGYAVLPDLSNAIIDMTEYGVPQNRKRIIILGVSKEHYGDKAEAMVEKFYSSYLPEYKIYLRMVLDIFIQIQSKHEQSLCVRQQDFKHFLTIIILIVVRRTLLR